MHENLPILILAGEVDQCYGILRRFTDSLRDALVRLGEDVVYIEDVYDILSYADKEYKAVITFMSAVMDVRVPGDTRPLFDHFYGPKFNYLTDHPFVLREIMKNAPKDYYILTLDKDYATFVERFYPGVGAFFLPLGGERRDEIKEFYDRVYDVTFVGTYRDWRKEIPATDDEVTAALIDEYLNCLVKNPDLTTDASLMMALEHLGIEGLDDQQFLDINAGLGVVAYRGASMLFRERVIKAIIDSGITIDVFGTSWHDAPFSTSKNLRIHDDVPPQKVYEIYENSKISLNVMSWHKNAVTERIVDSMLCGCAVLTEGNDAIREAFVATDSEFIDSDSEIMVFSLNSIDKIPRMIKAHLEDKELAARGYKKAEDAYTWDSMANRFLQICDNINVVE